MINRKYGQGTHRPQMGSDKSAENTPKAPKISAQIVGPSSKVWDLDEKRIHWASIVREPDKTQCGFIGFSWDVLGPIKKGLHFAFTTQMTSPRCHNFVRSLQTRVHGLQTHAFLYISYDQD